MAPETSKRKANAINSCFHSCFNTSLTPFSQEESTVTDSTFNSEELLCTEEEVLDLLQELDSYTSKSSGPDNISAKMLIGVSVSIAPVLTKLFNMSIAAAESLYCMLPILIQWMLVDYSSQ